MKTFTDALAYAKNKGFEIEVGSLGYLEYDDIRKVTMYRVVNWHKIECDHFLVYKGYEHHIPWEIKCMVDKFIEGVL